MALTIKLTKILGAGNDFIRLYRVTGDASYPSGGYPFGKAQLGMSFIDQVDPNLAGATGGATSYMVKWDNVTAPTAPTLRFYWSAGAGAAPTEVTVATSLAGVICDLRVYGV